MLLFAFILAYLIVYRGGLGTYCTVTGKTPPWVVSRGQRIAAQDPQAAKAYTERRSERTFRGWFGRLWGDIWEDLNAARDERRAWKLNGETPRRGWLRNLRRRGDVYADESDEDLEWTDPEIPETPQLDAQPPAEPTAEQRPACRTTLPHEHCTECGIEIVGISDGQPFCSDRCERDWYKRLIVRPTEPEPSVDAAPADDAAPAAEPEPEAGRPHLSVVPDAPENEPAPPAESNQPAGDGDTSMTNTINGPLVDEGSNIQAIDNFADQVKDSAGKQWPTAIDQARQNVTNAGLDDPKIADALGQMDEALEALTAAGQNLKQAMVPHVQLAEQVSGTTNHGSKIAAYEND